MLALIQICSSVSGVVWFLIEKNVDTFTRNNRLNQRVASCKCHQSLLRWSCSLIAHLPIHIHLQSQLVLGLKNRRQGTNSALLLPAPAHSIPIIPSLNRQQWWPYRSRKNALRGPTSFRTRHVEREASRSNMVSLLLKGLDVELTYANEEKLRAY